MNSSVLASSTVFCSGLRTWSADDIFVHYSESMTEKSKPRFAGKPKNVQHAILQLITSKPPK